MAAVPISNEALERAAVEHSTALAEAVKGYASTVARFNPALRNFALLTHLPGTLSANELDVYYTRYYWFHVLAAHVRAGGEFDAGLEQQAFQLLESAPTGVEWPLLEQFEQQATSYAQRPN